MVLLALLTSKFISPLFATKTNGDELEEDSDMQCSINGGLNLVEDLESPRLETKDRPANNCNESQPLLPMATATSSTIQRPTIAHLLKHPRILVSALCITWINVSWTFAEPILANRLDTFFHLSKKEIGVIFSISNVVYIPTAFLMQFAFASSNIRKRRFIILFSVAVTPLAVLLVGSSSIQCLIFGMLLLGLLPTPVWIFLLPSMQKDSLDVYDTCYRRVVNDLTAGIYNSFMIFGQIVGYLIGPSFNAMIGFRETTWIVSGLIFIQAVSYYYFVLSNASLAGLKSVRKA